jgi:uncharacterized protein YbaA (DUF1428 family)
VTQLAADLNPEEEPMPYIDSFVLAVPKKNVEKYRQMAQQSSAVWREHGALEYKEWIAEDVKPGEVTSFPQAVQAKEDEIVVVAWAVYKSRAHRDEVMTKVMNDPRMKIEPSTLPFDGKRMFWGGFEPLVSG